MHDILILIVTGNADSRGGRGVVVVGGGGGGGEYGSKMGKIHDNVRNLL